VKPLGWELAQTCQNLAGPEPSTLPTPRAPLRSLALFPSPQSPAKKVGVLEPETRLAGLAPPLTCWRRSKDSLLYCFTSLTCETK
jgi:hypothetical protein